jgi:hypothetical protein
MLGGLDILADLSIMLTLSIPATAVGFRWLEEKVQYLN